MAISYDDLWNKSKMFIEKAINKRDESDFEEFQLWASLTLEILGKATLAYIHPSLVVDPTNPAGLLVACGYSRNYDIKDIKTITAKTVYERLFSLINIERFDKNSKDFCMRLANDRNADLHSGAIPYTGVTLESWLPKFWDVCKMLLHFQNKSLHDLIGSDEASSAEDIISGRAEALQRSVEARISKHRDELLSKFDGNLPTELNTSIVILDEDEELFECPSCTMESGIVQGKWIDSGPEIPDEEDPWIIRQENTYQVISFCCRVCDLKLNGIDEIRFANINSNFIKVNEIEPDYEPDYGND